MTIWQRLSIVVVVLAASADNARAVDLMAKQQFCADKVRANMAATARDKPEVMKTVMGYLFEYSPSRDTCVEVIQYRVHDAGKPSQVQVGAYNAITQQPMEGYRHIFLEDAGDSKGIQDATNFLFDRYSK